MFTHAQMWSGIDRLARHHGLTPSGLARKAGLDPTTFNPSKRITKENKSRWPSTESLAKILDATGTPFPQFVAMMSQDEANAPVAQALRMPCIAFDHARREGLFDAAGFPTGDQWDAVDFPNLDDRHAYALEVRGDDLLPVFRDGDLLIISPSADVRRHDRILLRLESGSLVAGTLRRRTAQRVEIEPFADGPQIGPFAVRELAWLSRIVWASQ